MAPRCMSDTVCDSTLVLWACHGCESKVEVLYTTETIYDTNGESDTLIYIKKMHLNGFLTQCGYYYDGYQEYKYVSSDKYENLLTE